MRRLVLLAASAVLVTPAHAQSTAAPTVSYTTQLVDTSYGLSVHARSDYARASTALAEARYAEARRLLTRLADGSFDSRLQLMAGYANLGDGKPRLAGVYFERALGLDGSSVFARHGMGLAAHAAGDSASAAAQLKILVAARERCTRECRDTAKLDQAIGSLRRVIG